MLHDPPAAPHRATATPADDIYCEQRAPQRSALAAGWEYSMIALYTAPTPNGWKGSVTLAELEIPYETRSINMTENKEDAEEFAKNAQKILQR
jgi:hypothetical protein